MTRAAFATLMAHWRRHPSQLITLLLGLALATALWSAVQAINAEARASYGAAASTLTRGTVESLVHPEGRISMETFTALRRAGWRVSPVVEGRMAVGDASLTIIGIDPITAPPGALPAADDGDPFSPLTFLTPPGLGFASPSTIADISGADALPPLRPTEQVSPGQIITDISTALRLLGPTQGIERLLVRTEQPLGRAPLADIAPDLERIAPATADGSDIARLTASFHLNLTAFGLLSFAVGLFIAHGAIGLALEQRRTTLRTLRALGLPLHRLVALLAVEFAVFAVLAGALGVALGYLIAAALLPDVAATLRGLYGADVSGGLRFDPVWALAGLGMTLLGTGLAAASGLWQIARLPILASARPRAWGLANVGQLRAQAIAGAALLALGAAAPVLADGLLAGFALLGGILLGAALLLPLVLSLALSRASTQARQPLAQWFWADTRQQVPGLSLALMALLLALATNIGVATMVSSFRVTFTGWLDQRLAADLYLTTQSASETEAITAWLATRPDVTAVLPTARIETRLAGAPGEVYGIVDDATYRENWPLLEATPDVWRAVAEGRAVLVNEQLARRANLSLGDAVTLTPGWSLPLAGIYSDYGNPAGQALTARDALLDRHPAARQRQLGLRTDAPDEVTRMLMDTFGLATGAIIDQKRLKAISLQIFERTFTVTAALNALTLSVAGVAILTALLTLASMRLPQLAPIWAIGLSRRRLAALEVVRALALAGLTFMLALPVGLALAWALLAIVNVEAFGWRLPMALFPSQWATLLALALIAALLAAALPARRLARTPPATFLKVFADDR